MPDPPACYGNAGLAERQFGDLARRYAACLNETDELGGAALAALDPLGIDGMEALEAAPNGDASKAPEPVKSRALALIAPGVKAVEAVRRRVPSANDWLVARNERLIARGERTLKRRVAVAARAGRR